MFRRILVPTDFSDGAMHALRLAVTLARESGGHVTVFHCAPPVDLLGHGTVENALYYGALMDQLAEELERLLTRTVGDEIPEGLSHDHAHVIGFPPDEIVRRAKHGSYDLVVMGTHGRTGVDRVLMGSVTERVIRRSEVPVLVCR
jgi:nucleotide-binding universal stress UspA family protein